jgi:glycosyltransferase involved in cell wall biosynthesis
MKIAFDAKRAFFNRSGLGNYSRSLISMMASYYPDNEYHLFSPSEKSTLYQPPTACINHYPVGIYKFAPGLWRLHGIKKQLSRCNPDIYHGLSNELPLGINHTGIKSIVTIHDLIFEHYPENYSVVDRNIYHRKFNYACHTANHIVATSVATRNDIVERYGIDQNKISVLYQACSQAFTQIIQQADKDIIRAKYQLPEKYLLYVGTIEKRKNALTLLKALHSAKVGIPLVIVGKPTSYIDELKAFINQTPGVKVEFRHQVTSVDLPALYQMAEFFCYPSVIEGFGIPIVEAMNSGVPVITSTGSCFAETGGEAALYCDPADAVAMGVTIGKVLNNSELKSKMIAAGFQQAKKFRPEKLASELMEIYNKVNS